jgi:protein disulfide-isomerase
VNKSILLLLLIGVGVVGYLRRDTISELIKQRREQASSSSEGETLPAGSTAPAIPRPPATPHPAQEAIAQARQAYPALAKGGSAFNLHFLALYNDARLHHPDLLVRPNWPIKLAEHTAKDLGGAAMPIISTQGAGWTDDYALALQSAKVAGKNLLLNFSGSDWCPYSEAIEKEVFSSSKFQAWARDRVILVQLDFPHHHPQDPRVKQQNTDLQARFPFEGYPAIFVVDTNGHVLGRTEGYNPGTGPDAYLDHLEKSAKR